jgi:hypothetical protein
LDIFFSLFPPYLITAGRLFGYMFLGFSLNVYWCVVYVGHLPCRLLCCSPRSQQIECLVGILLAADSQTTSASGYRASFWDPWPDFSLLFFLRLTITLVFFLRCLLRRENGSVVYKCNHSLVRLLTPNNHTLPSHLRLCSLFVASYDSQGLWWKYSNPPPHGVECLVFIVVLLYITVVVVEEGGGGQWNMTDVWYWFLLKWLFISLKIGLCV